MPYVQYQGSATPTRRFAIRSVEWLNRTRIGRIAPLLLYRRAESTAGTVGSTCSVPYSTVPLSRYMSRLPPVSFYRYTRLRAGAGRRSGSGWRQGRVRRGRPLLSRPRGAVDSGLAAVLVAVESVVVFVRVCRWLWVDGSEVRPCDPCARARPCVPCVPCVAGLRAGGGVSAGRSVKITELN